MADVPDVVRTEVLLTLTDDELRAEARRRGMELHSKQFSQAAQQALRELEELRRRIDELASGLREESKPQIEMAPPSGPGARRIAKPGESI